MVFRPLKDATFSYLACFPSFVVPGDVVEMKQPRNAYPKKTFANPMARLEPGAAIFVIAANEWRGGGKECLVVTEDCVGFMYITLSIPNVIASASQEVADVQ